MNEYNQLCSHYTCILSYRHVNSILVKFTISMKNQMPYAKHRSRSMHLQHLVYPYKELIGLQSLNEEAQYLFLAEHFLAIFAFGKQRYHPISANKNRVKLRKCSIHSGLLAEQKHSG